ncbi:type II toxin-antitoxin system Phd/YefM family antitoxin [Pseudomonas cannabina]|uniref:Uncharacterized protein n=1 Tax=Pseudomonas cannabina pv. alisalensis TaxID=757414 RepID=A0ABS1XFX9_PSEC1|nr:hypothetical protein [Pseudomonas cannabina]MBM0140394.1 hypothetical protein [Pseudomonas cannabina pv. alisalensis]
MVILPISDYNGLQETIYLLGSTANAQRLKKLIAQLKLSHHTRLSFASCGDGGRVAVSILHLRIPLVSHTLATTDSADTWVMAEPLKAMQAAKKLMKDL